MEELLDYIALVLHEPRSARRIYNTLKAEILSLAEPPFRYPLLRDEAYRSLGIRRILIENYAAFYTVDKQQQTVHVIRILYNRREWQSLL